MLLLEYLLLSVFVGYGLFIVYSKAVWAYEHGQGFRIAAKIVCPAPITFGIRWRQRNIKSVESFFVDESASDYAQFKDFLKKTLRASGILDVAVVSLIILATWFLALLDWVGYLFVALAKKLGNLVKISAQLLQTK
jgi:hypothetical protein